MRNQYPDLPRAFWAAMSRLACEDLRAVQAALDTRFAAGLAQGRGIEIANARTREVGR